MVDCVAQPESKVRRDLIVATAAGVQLAPGVANQLDESCFDKRVDVLRLRIVTTAFFENRFQAVTDSRSVGGRDYFRVLEGLAVRDARRDIDFKQPPVEAKGVIDGREAGISFVGESPTPHKSKVSLDRKSTRLNSSHSQISYAVFCL